MIRESAIIHETAAGHHVTRAGGRLEVRRHAGTHSVTDCAFPDTPDGLSLARARANYLEQNPPRPRVQR